MTVQTPDATQRLEREELIEAIMETNRGVGRAWLESFPTPSLREYLSHLDLVNQPRGTIWVRSSSQGPAIERRAA